MGTGVTPPLQGPRPQFYRGRSGRQRALRSGRRLLDVGRPPGRRLERRGEVRGQLVDLSVTDLDQGDGVPRLAVRVFDLTGRREPIPSTGDHRWFWAGPALARLLRCPAGIVLDDPAPIVLTADALT